MGETFIKEIKFRIRYREFSNPWIATNNEWNKIIQRIKKNHLCQSNSDKDG
jgi:hypothetical protein